MNKFIPLLFSVLVFSFACEKIVEIELNQSMPQLVIEGLLTNRDTVHFVKVSKSVQFYDTGLSPVTDAIINVTGKGQAYSYSHNPMGIDSMQGYYFSDVAYAGKIGESYTLNVEVDGINYNATDTLRFVTPIDSLMFAIDLSVSEEDEEDGKIYQVILYAKEPSNSEDFYQFKFYRNRKLITYSTDVYVFSDVALGPTLDGVPSPVLFREGELASVQIYSLTKEQYLFYEDLESLLNNDGGMFSPPPANPRNTFSNPALGLWQVSAISEDSIRIEL